METLKQEQEALNNKTLRLQGLKATFLYTGAMTNLGAAPSGVAQQFQISLKQRRHNVAMLMSFVRNTREYFPGMMSISKMKKVIEVVHTSRITCSSLEDYVNRDMKSKVFFTERKAKQLHRKLNNYIDRSKTKQTSKQKTELISLPFIKKLLERYHKMGGKEATLTLATL